MAIKGAAHLDPSTNKLVSAERDTSGLLLAANNLSDVTSVSTALANLGINGSPIGILATITGIDGTALGSTTLYTPSGKQAVVLAVVPRITAASGVISVASASVGQNVNVNDIIPITALTNLNAVNIAFPLNVVLPAVVVQSGSPIKFKITTAYVASAVTLAIDLIGYLL